MSRPAINWLVVILAVLVPTFPARACSIPVFRYALERWAPDAYQVMVLHRGVLSKVEQGLVDQLQSAAIDEAAPLNLNVRAIDLAEEPDADARRLLTRHGMPGHLPWLMVRYPKAVERDKLAWAGPLTPDSVAGLVDSPTRRQVARRLVEGESAVWVLIECSDGAKNDKAEATLRDQLKIMEETLELPTIDDLGTDESSHKMDVELRLAFSILRMDRNDPAERVFTSILLNSEPDLDESDEPVVIPVFGRGRMYYALVGRGVNADTIEENCRFIVGDCSCEVKALNPGIDLLFAVNWQKQITGSAFLERELPELAGPGLLETGSNGTGDNTDPVVAWNLGANETPVYTVGGSSRALWVAMGIAVALGLIVIVAGTVVMRTRARKRRRNESVAPDLA